ncbi:hypothetical protein OG746_37975 [Streptomyces sp. NBC_01016]|uniref:hypothetical protein n=1 Tax=Streptomyces sp. NBC_01016 TaxID=2903720 RepID=UPI002257CAF4|nr:hypothetical protein [Streptomyces sp. NBC_01016]MCX4834503.1 hypothetical protein [Streptomyces sp. NBC_01016]
MRFTTMPDGGRTYPSGRWFGANGASCATAMGAVSPVNRSAAAPAKTASLDIDATITPGEHAYGQEAVLIKGGRMA